MGRGRIGSIRPKVDLLAHLVKPNQRVAPAGRSSRRRNPGRRARRRISIGSRQPTAQIPPRWNPAVRALHSVDPGSSKESVSRVGPREASTASHGPARATNDERPVLEGSPNPKGWSSAPGRRAPFPFSHTVETGTIKGGNDPKGFPGGWLGGVRRGLSRARRLGQHLSPGRLPTEVGFFRKK